MANELNNRAVARFAEGRLEDAQRVLQRALDDFLGSILRPQEEDHAENVDVVDRPNMESTRDPKTIQLPAKVDEAYTAFSPYNAYSLYDRAIEVSNQQIHPDEMPVVLLYNTGLALHARGLCKANNGLLRQAMEIYNMAYVLTKESAVIASPILRVACVAILANMSNIHAHFGNDSQAFSLYNCLRGAFEQAKDHLSISECLVFQHMFCLQALCSKSTLPGAA